MAGKNQRTSVTIADVARTAGVSTATVSRVLNGVTTVDSSLVERVNVALAETGFVPNEMGRALRRQRSDLWAAIIPDVQNPFFTSVVAALEDVAAEHGFNVLVCNTDERLDRERRYIYSAVSNRMAGVVVSVASTSKSDLSALDRAGIPVITIDRDLRGYQGDSIMLDNYEAGRTAAAHLAGMGYQSVAVIAGPADVSTSQQRLEAAGETLTELGVGLPERLIRRVPLRADDAELAARNLLAGPDRPDAIFAVNGPLTMGAYRAIQSSGLQMPQQIALVGVDDDVWTRMVHPAVTVIQQPVQQIGRYAGQMLAERAAKPDEESGREAYRVLLDPVLLPRASSLPA